MKIHYTDRLCGIPRTVRFLFLYCMALLLGLPPVKAQLSRLHADGQRIVNAQGQEIILKGVGLGGWWLQEGYMIKPSFSGGGTQWSIKQRLYNQGQSDAQVEAFYQSWRDNFITRADIDYIASLGFNCVRLPMHYELFLNASQRAVRANVARSGNNSTTYNNYVSSLTSWYNSNQLFVDNNLEGFRLIDSLLKWTAANNMYVILDLHAAPGDQGTDTNIADGYVGNDFWNKTIYRDMTVRLWQKLSTRYAGNNGVAMYDLINEPNNVPGGNPPIHDIFERLINAVRAQGDDHLLMVEGNGWGNNYNYMEPFTFSNRTNLVYNAHRYGNSTSTTATSGDVNQISELGNIVNFRNTNNVPVWVGETGENNTDWMSANIAAMNSIGVGWSHWTYKRTADYELPSILRINPPYLMDGAGNMSAVLNNIKFSNNIRNNSTIAAVAPGISKPQAILGKTIWLKGFNGKYVTNGGTTTPLWCNGDAVGAAQQFDVIDMGYNRIALRNNGLYVSSENGTKAMTCSRTAPQNWESFEVFTNADGSIFLRGSNGQYVSSENGTKAMNCNRPTGSGWEAFTYGIVGGGGTTPPPPGNGVPVGKTIWLQGNTGQYVSSKGGTTPMFCNATAVQGWNQFLVVDAGNGKIALQNTGMYVSSENGEQPMNCNRPAFQDWETFTWVARPNGKISLLGNNGKYVSSENSTQAMNCNRDTIGAWEEFGWGEVNAAAQSAAVFAAALPNNFKIVGYMPSWSGDVNKVQYSKLTHINYAFVLPNTNGTLQGLDNPGKLQSLVSKAHANGVKVSISIGGWNDGNDNGFEQLAKNAGTRTTFVNAVMSLVNQYGLDGADIDWEYPDDGASANNYLTLMTQLSSTLHAQGKLLTAAVVSYGGSSILNGVFSQVDFLNIMAYDENNFQHSTYDLAVKSLNYWVGRGLAKAKAVLGVPFYGRPTFDNYNVLLSQGANPNADVFNNIGYNGIPTIKNKTTLSMNTGGGIMIWELSGDENTGNNSLLSAIYSTANSGGGTTPPPASGAPVGKTIWLQGNNGQYVSSKGGVNPMFCNATIVQGWNQFLVSDAGNGKVTLQNQGLFVSSENGEQAMNCNRPAAQEWEQFDWINNADGTVSLRGNSGFVSSENGAQAMTCNRATAQGWEEFNWGVVSGSAAIAAAKVPEEAMTVDVNGALLVYPNPVTPGSTLNVNVKKYDATAPVQASLIDVNQKVISYRKVNAASFNLPTGNAASGFYILVIKNGTNSYTKKVLIQ